jgi:hypothetical protein
MVKRIRKTPDNKKYRRRKLISADGMDIFVNIQLYKFSMLKDARAVRHISSENLASRHQIILRRPALQ